MAGSKIAVVLRCASIWGPYLQSFVVNHLHDLILTSAAATCAEKFLETWRIDKDHRFIDEESLLEGLSYLVSG